MHPFSFSRPPVWALFVTVAVAASIPAIAEPKAVKAAVDGQLPPPTQMTKGKPTGSFDPMAECNNPDALGVSRVMEVGTSGGAAVGFKTYPRSLKLSDHEVVLTFDDGPAPGTTQHILDALKQECVLATFFLIGKNAQAHSALVQREKAEHQTIAFHSYSHPAATLRNLATAAGEAEITLGVEAVEKAARIEPRPDKDPPPRLFRFPGFADSKPLLQYLARNNFAVFGADLWASDWARMTPEAQLQKIMTRLDEAGSGIILFHDTREQTVSMLPEFLRRLKSGGYKIVHIVPVSGQIETKPAPPGWASETEAIIARVMSRSKKSDRENTDSLPTHEASHRHDRDASGKMSDMEVLEGLHPVPSPLILEPK